MKELGNGLYGTSCLSDKLCWFLLRCSDDEIEKIEGDLAVKEIFRLKGETQFRKTEVYLIRTLM